MSQTTLFVIEALLKYGPALARQLLDLLRKDTDPTIEEWDALFARVADKSYEDYVR